jgi:hypothetical protein
MSLRSWTRLSCCSFAAHAVRLQLHALAYNLGNFLRTLATPEPIKDWSLTSLKEKLTKIGAKVVRHGRYVAFEMAEVAIPRQMFQEILQLIAELRPQPAPARCARWSCVQQRPTGGVRPNAGENSQISSSTTVRAARVDGSRPNLASVLQEGRKNASIRASSGLSSLPATPAPSCLRVSRRPIARPNAAAQAWQRQRKRPDMGRC